MWLEVGTLVGARRVARGFEGGTFTETPGWQQTQEYPGGPPLAEWQVDQVQGVIEGLQEGRRLFGNNQVIYDAKGVQLASKSTLRGARHRRSHAGPSKSRRGGAA
ncbi:MAG: hypothetical protein ACE366_16820 [Bradymonadia bacterium]